ncbi:MAG TPA: MBL fold metallo-hydrolase [Terriglobales bacterium]|nr:MBL fold metallo-hydrolase [Terriglobales bacterium]
MISYSGIPGNNSSPGITVKYIYSACITTSSKDVRILHDPWFSEGIYDGSWFHFPVVSDPIGSIGDVDLIYVSHVHPDHYDASFLRKFFAVYGQKKIIIADHQPNHLANKMRVDGFEPTILTEPIRVGSTTIRVLPHCTGSISDIDSAVIIGYFDGEREHCVVNANDVIFDDDMISMMKENASGADILLCGYTGAGPYPQTYFDTDDPQLLIEAEKKKQSFFERYTRLVSALNPKVTIPFAGQYLLGGKLAKLNSFRGVADATEVLTIDSKAIVLRDGGAKISTRDLRPSAVRVQPYSNEEIQRREQEISAHKFDYERLIAEKEIHQLPLKRLLASAAKKANEKSECREDYFFIIKLPDSKLAIINANRDAKPIIKFSTPEVAWEPRSEISIDPRYLFGLLTGVYHWNNAEVGSQYQTRRFPNRYNAHAQSFLNYLVV